MVAVRGVSWPRGDSFEKKKLNTACECSPWIEKFNFQLQENIYRLLHGKRESRETCDFIVHVQYEDEYWHALCLFWIPYPFPQTLACEILRGSRIVPPLVTSFNCEFMIHLTFRKNLKNSELLLKFFSLSLWSFNLECWIRSWKDSSMWSWYFVLFWTSFYLILFALYKICLVRLGQNRSFESG